MPALLSLLLVHQVLLMTRHGIFHTEDITNSPPTSSTGSSMLTLFPSTVAIPNLLHSLQIFPPISRKKVKTKPKQIKKHQAAAATYLPENKDIPAPTLILKRVSEEVVSCLPSKVGVQELGALGFIHETHGKGGKRNRSSTW